MKYSIRTRLTLAITFVFLFIFYFILVAGAIALYLGLNEEIDRDLRVEEKRMSELFISQFQELLIEKGEIRKSLRNRFVEELKEIYRYKRQFVIFSLESNTSRRIYAGSELKNVQLLLPKGFLSQKNGNYNQRFDGDFYRVRIIRKDWGTLVIGAKNETFFQVSAEFKEIFLVGIPLVIILILIGGRLLAKRAMHPVVSAAETAEKISLTNLKQRLSDYNKKDEFGTLVATLNKMIARIDDEVKSVQNFTQDAAHELRTPLTILRGELELLFQQDGISDDIRSALQRTLDRTISLNKIVDDLMLLAQSDSGHYTLDKSSFQLDQVIRETVEDVKILAEKRPIKVNLNDCDPVEFFGDEQLIRRLLLNLSDNALKNTEKGLIYFYLKSHQDTAEIKIKDTGIGIPKEDLPHIIDRFYRVEKTGTCSNKGSGLGLSICKWIVEAHDGVVNIKSEEGKGTTIIIEFPLLLRNN